MGCILWTKGKTGSGYGAAYVKNDEGKWKQITAHRLSYETYKGPVEKGLVVLHSCDNKLCINPDHLSLGAQKENIKDMFNKGRQHDRRGDNGNHSKLSTFQVKEIKLKLQFKSVAVIAREYGVAHTTVHDIKSGRTWSHIQ